MVTTGYTDCSYVKLQQSVKMTFFLQIVFTPVFNTFLNTWRVGKYNCKWPVEYFLSLLPCSDCWHTHCFSLVFSFEYNRILPFFDATLFSYYETFFCSSWTCYVHQQQEFSGKIYGGIYCGWISISIKNTHIVNYYTSYYQRYSITRKQGNDLPYLVTN